jgi:outer membrane murein-binding lipoprotein Lpp
MAGTPGAVNQRSRIGAGFVVILAAFALAGCGGPMRPEELSASIDTLSSSAAEGELLAGDVAEDRTKATFARAHARELGDVVNHEAEKLADATPRPGIADEKSQAVDLADEISQALGQIQVRPSDERTGRESQRQLSQLADRATRLADSL